MTIKRLCFAAINLAPFFLACSPPVAGVWKLDETTVTADFIGCDEKPGRQSGTAFDVGELSLDDDGTYRIALEYEIVVAEVYIRWPFRQLDQPTIVTGFWAPAEGAIRIEDGADLGFIGGWDVSFRGDDMLLAGRGSAIFEPCGSDEKFVTHLLKRANR